MTQTAGQSRLDRTTHQRRAFRENLSQTATDSEMPDTPWRRKSQAEAHVSPQTLLQMCAPGHITDQLCRQQNKSLKCKFSVSEYDLWGRSRAINKSAAFTLDGLSEARSYKVCTIAASQSALSWKAIKMCATVLMLSMCPRPCNASAQLQRAQCRI